MKKKSLSLFLALILLCGISVFASADSSKYHDGDVTFTAGGQMVEKYFDFDQLYENLEPGDEVSYTVYIHNQHPKTTRWYMSNEVLNSLEEADNGSRYKNVKGGAYSYKLTYAGPGGSQVIYDSAGDDGQHVNFVGGDDRNENDVLIDSDNRIGLHEATGNLEEFFFLDTLNSGESGVVTLTVSLEGETQGNYYQNTAAEIQMNFAVELKDGKEGGGTAVKTGDENNLTPYYIGMVVAGLLFLYLALDALTDRMYKKGKG